MVALILAGCGTNPKTVTIKVVATTDVHGCIFNTDCVDVSDREGSLAKFATFLARERKENRNVVYLDAGDVLQGSIEVYQDATSQFLRSPLVSEAYNYLDCEAIAMGNHDLSAGSAVYDRFMRALGCPVLSANLYYVESGDFLLPYRIIERQGVRIAVLGLTTPVVRYSIPQDQMAEISVGDMVRTAQKWVPVLRDELKADVVIGLFHSGLEEGRMDAEGVYEDDSRRVVATVPGFDAVIYGHDHEANCTSVVNCEGDTVIMINPGPYALNAAELTVTVDRENARVDASARLVDITGEIPDRDFERHLAGWQSDVRSYADSLIGTLNCDLESNGVLWRSGTAMDYIHTIQMRFAGAEVSLTAPVPTATLIPAGDMRIRDVSKLYRYENTMVSVMVIADENAKGKHYIGGGEESFGFLAEDFVRDKDAVSACSLMAEIAAWAKENGKTLFDLLLDAYQEYGFSQEAAVSVVKPGKSGADEIKAMMEQFRANPPKSLAGEKVVLVKDFKLLKQTDASGKVTDLDMPEPSNVLQYFTAAGDKISVRPSGTEPKIKFYMEAKLPMASKKDYLKVQADALRKIDGFKKDLGI